MRTKPQKNNRQIHINKTPSTCLKKLHRVTRKFNRVNEHKHKSWFCLNRSIIKQPKRHNLVKNQTESHVYDTKSTDLRPQQKDSPPKHKTTRKSLPIN